MNARIYWWLWGAPEGRIGGPWWCRDFETEGAARRWAVELYHPQIVKELRLLVANELPLPGEYVRPPIGAVDLVPGG